MNSIQRFIRSGFIDDASSIVATFRQRVLADSGTFESEGYLINWLKQNRDLYNRASFLLTPNGYKAGTLYAFKGQDFNTFLRAGNATRINSVFGQELMTNNVPRLDYEHGTPTFINEVVNTNLWINNSNATITVVSGSRYALSFFGTGTVEVTGGFTATVVGTSDTVKTFTIFGNVGASSTSVTLTVTGTVFWGNFVLAGASNALNQPTSHIPTPTTIVTRAVDNYAPLTLGTSMFDTPYMVVVDFISTQNTLIGTEGGVFEIQTDINNTISMLGSGLTTRRIAGAQSTIASVTINSQFLYGRRLRTILYVNPSTGQVIKVNSVQINGTWQSLGMINNGTGFTLPTGLDKVQLARWRFGQSTMKFKTFAILKDFTGISNIQAYMQALSLRPSI
jgi:hypothetical protein